VLIALIAASLLASGIALDQGRGEASEAAQDRADRAAVALERVFASTSARLEGVRALFAASETVTQDEFRTYAAQVLREATLNGVAVTVMVPHAQRAAYERRSGRPILEPGIPGPRPAAVRPFYYPVTNVVTRVPDGDRLLGVDAGAEPARQAALRTARDLGAATASAPVSLLTSGRLGIVVSEPIYAPGRPLRTVAERRAALTGFAFSGFQTERLGAEVLAQMAAGTRLQIFDRGIQVFGPAGALEGARERTLKLAGSDWRIVATGPAVAWGLPLSILIGGLLMSVLVALLMRESLRRERYALNLVEERLREQRAVEAALREREGQLAEAQRMAHVGSWEWDVDANVVRWSDEMCRLFGVPPEGFGAAYDEYLARVHPDDREHVDETVVRAMSAGAPFSFHHRLVRPDGGVRILNARGRVERDGDGRVVRMLGSAQDVTEARHAEEELRRQRDYAAGLVSAMQDGLFMLSPAGEVAEASPSFCALTGFSREELVGTRLPFPFWPQCSEEKLARAFARLEAEGAAEWDLEFRTRDGAALPVILSAFVLRGADGAATGYAGTVKDVTERQAVQRLKDEFVALASHELRTPLSSVLGYLELVLDEDGALGPLNTEQRRFLGVAERNGRKLSRLVADLLAVARWDAGRLALELEEVDLAAVARECGDGVQPQAAERGIAVSVHASAALWFVADRARIVQVLDNLLSNALKFTPPGGRVDLRVGARDDRAVIEVADTGMGVAAAEQGRLFERFYRTSAATREAIPGTGLGLAISKMIVEAHAGSITVESEEGRGTTFVIALPLRPAQAPARAGSAAAAGA
jgi:PAS domain S-box-containing protein